MRDYLAAIRWTLRESGELDLMGFSLAVGLLTGGTSWYLNRVGLVFLSGIVAVPAALAFLICLMVFIGSVMTERKNILNEKRRAEEALVREVMHM